MRPGRLNLTCPRGGTFIQPLHWAINGVGVDMTGYTARMQVRRKHTSTEVLVTLDEETGITLTDDGWIHLEIDDEITEEFPLGTYKYDLKLYSPSGRESFLVEGDFYVTPVVTTDA